ncbi:uncharacterized protein LOC106170075 isoform X2 [Lingula anatina]|uniref:Uncharacterized protein LOC106170075 isoform X1 n=1 Tax=Lingula anatina TaxID=7574 RepID=A0A1S3J4Q6_LINAN|nr:uncharacterized protein LOC106170075 isoform X1 [Lingula anatina]XP_013405263.1 uncharacterized protein LOC106170075 isoform X2 [Lingula anatina]|eukprot:XP_013405262.1 uncharacterized protein LOC106170075 isoform X1 [Lingula anatina]
MEDRYRNFVAFNGYFQVCFQCSEDEKNKKNEIENQFSTVGKVMGVSFSNKYCFVKFQTKAEALKALDELSCTYRLEIPLGNLEGTAKNAAGQKPRNGGLQTYTHQGGGGDASQDWVCSNCGNLNFEFRVRCNMCQCDRQLNNRLYSDVPKSISSPFTGVQIYVGGLPFNVTEDEVLETFQMFCPVNVHKPKAQKVQTNSQYFFVEFASADMAARACIAFDGYKVRGKSIHVSFASHTNPDVMEQALKDLVEGVRAKYKWADKKKDKDGQMTNKNTPSVTDPLQGPTYQNGDSATPSLFSMTVDHVSSLLRDLSLIQHVPVFRSYGVDGEMLNSMTEPGLDMLGMINPLEKAKLLGRVEKMKRYSK